MHSSKQKSFLRETRRIQPPDFVSLCVVVVQACQFLYCSFCLTFWECLIIADSAGGTMSRPPLRPLRNGGYALAARDWYWQVGHHLPRLRPQRQWPPVQGPARRPRAASAEGGQGAGRLGRYVCVKEGGRVEGLILKFSLVHNWYWVGSELHTGSGRMPNTCFYVLEWLMLNSSFVRTFDLNPQGRGFDPQCHRWFIICHAGRRVFTEYGVAIPIA